MNLFHVHNSYDMFSNQIKYPVYIDIFGHIDLLSIYGIRDMRSDYGIWFKEKDQFSPGNHIIYLLVQLLTCQSILTKWVCYFISKGCHAKTI